MDDPQIHGTIEQLVAEEHELWRRESAGLASEADRQRLQQLKVSLEQCWDLLRQRRATARSRPGSGHRCSSRNERRRELRAVANRMANSLTIVGVIKTAGLRIGPLSCG